MQLFIWEGEGRNDGAGRVHYQSFMLNGATYAVGEWWCCCDCGALRAEMPSSGGDPHFGSCTWNELKPSSPSLPFPPLPHLPEQGIVYTCTRRMRAHRTSWAGLSLLSKMKPPQKATPTGLRYACTSTFPTSIEIRMIMYTMPAYGQGSACCRPRITHPLLTFQVKWYERRTSFEPQTK